MARKFAFVSCVLAALAGHASADELVRVRQRGGSGSAPLQGYLTKPKGEGPFPAVVLLHSCLGLGVQPTGDRRDLRQLGLCRALRRRFRDAGLERNLLPRLRRSRARRARRTGVSGDAAFCRRQAHRRRRLFAGRRYSAAARLHPSLDFKAAYRRLSSLRQSGECNTANPDAHSHWKARRGDASSKIARPWRERRRNAKLVVFPGASHLFDDPSVSAGGARVRHVAQIRCGRRRQCKVRDAGVSQREPRALVGPALANPNRWSTLLAPEDRAQTGRSTLRRGLVMLRREFLIGAAAGIFTASRGPRRRAEAIPPRYLAADGAQGRLHRLDGRQPRRECESLEPALRPL